jgi:hypothetical protein
LLDDEDVDDLEDAPDNEVEAAEEQILDQATAPSAAFLRIPFETASTSTQLLAQWKANPGRISYLRNA